MEEAARHPHNVARSAFVDVAGVPQNAPVPRFSRTAAPLPRAPSVPGAQSGDILAELGYDEAQIAALRRGGVAPT
jgi:alpha-methylacyl-CoA racemase